MMRFENYRNIAEEPGPGAVRFPLLARVLQGLELPLIEVLDEQAPTRNMPAPPDRGAGSEKEIS